MMTTVTLPVFNRTDLNNQSLAGVMGVDVALRDLLDFEPFYQIGPAGYSFGIDQNGYVVFHPNLKTSFEVIDDSLNLDLLDVEIKSLFKEELRDAMINLATSNRSFTSLLRMPNSKHIVEHKMKYYFTPLNKTTFSIAIVLPADRTHFLSVDKMEIPPGFDLNRNEMEGMFLAPWKYCHNKVLNLEISRLIKNLSHTAIKDPKSCKTDLLHRLVWDIRKTSDIMHYWQSEDQDFQRDGAIATFVQSESGLTRIYPPSEARHIERLTDPAKSTIYARAFYGNDYIFLLPDSEFNSTTNLTEPAELVITIAKAISFARSGVTYKPAVVGIMIDPEWLQPFLLEHCPDEDYLVCYLVDDGGFIVSTNQPDNLFILGMFLGIVDSEIMNELYKKKVYIRNEDFNYDDRCKKEQKASTGIRRVPMPFYSVISNLNLGWLFVDAWYHLKHWFMCLFSLFNLPKFEALPEFYELANETTCTTHEAQYYWGKWNKSYSGIIACNNCTRHYTLNKVGQTNIILLVTEKPCAPLFCNEVPQILQAKREVDTKDNQCDRPLRYRKRPEKCFHSNINEDNTVCTAAAYQALPCFVLNSGLLLIAIMNHKSHHTL